MKNNLLIITVMLLFGLPGIVQGQSRKKIKESGIKSMVVHEYFLEESKDKYIVESQEKYDSEGRVIEIKEFNSRSEVKKWEKYVYDDKDRITEEIFLNPKGSIESREKTVYDGDFRKEKLYYDSKNNLVKKKVYIYKYE